MSESIRVEDLQVFLHSITRYFEKITGHIAEAGLPFAKGDEEFLLDYTGIIGVSGKYRGAVCFTADLDLLVALLTCSGERDLRVTMAEDAVGEVANVIAGNARSHFGPQFLISVPVVVKGKPKSVNITSRNNNFVIPILWRKHRAYLLVGFE
ncbi:MAG: chemotaxis protein CheX [Verrucomicrobiales bacterium]